MLKMFVCARACMSKCVCEGIHTQPAVGFARLVPVWTYGTHALKEAVGDLLGHLHRR